MRTFTIIFKLKGKLTAYEFLPIDKAIKVMNFLTRNGFNPVCQTSANGITEQLTLKELEVLND